MLDLIEKGLLIQRNRMQKNNKCLSKQSLTIHTAQRGHEKTEKPSTS